MKIIDAHIHYLPNSDHFNQIAQNAGHSNEESHLSVVCGKMNIAHTVVMGNRGFSLTDHRYPEFMSYCVGLDQKELEITELETSVALVEQHLRRDRCVGIKIYAGYNRYDPVDASIVPFYELAQTYDKPVAVHMGTTASRHALLKYSHPLLLDEAATLYPHVQFVMCHFGNPWLADAAAVMEKNQNVAADLSGLLVGCVDVPNYMRKLSGYVEQLRTWIDYVEDYDRFLYGTDWPLVNMQNYADFITRLIPEKYHEKVFFDNANRVYGLGK